VSFAAPLTGSELIVRNELWDHESNHSGSYLPPMKAEYDARSVAASGYGGEYGRPGSVMTAQGPGNGYNPRGITPMASYQDLQAQSRAASFYAPPGSIMGMNEMSPFASNPNLQQAGMYDNRSLYQAAPGPGSAYNSFYGGPQLGQQLDHRASAYSLNQQAQAVPQGVVSRPSSQFLPPSRPATQVLPEMNQNEWQPLDMGEAGITTAKLEQSIRRICAEADLDNLTKKGVRKQLEQEHGVGLDQRKETINRIIEQVLNGE
jgi:chitin synthase